MLGGNDYRCRILHNPILRCKDSSRFHEIIFLFSKFVSILDWIRHVIQESNTSRAKKKKRNLTNFSFIYPIRRGDNEQKWINEPFDGHGIPSFRPPLITMKLISFYSCGSLELSLVTITFFFSFFLFFPPQQVTNKGGGGWGKPIVTVM